MRKVQDQWKAGSRRDGLPEGENPPMRCGCGRVTNADMLTEVPAEVRPHFRGDRYACDACRERFFVSGVGDREAWYAALGAPPEALERVRGYMRRRSTT